METQTPGPRSSAALSSQQANTPHGDGNPFGAAPMVDCDNVTTGKYPSRGWKLSLHCAPQVVGMWSQQANTPHGDGNRVEPLRKAPLKVVTTGKYPSRGWKPRIPSSLYMTCTASQQANTPHGDGNFLQARKGKGKRIVSQQANTPHGDGNLVGRLGGLDLAGVQRVATDQYPSRGWKLGR